MVWRRLLAWAPWPLFLAVVAGFLLLGWALSGVAPLLTVLCGLAPLFMGVTTCLAYMFIDLERYEVERGYKAVHNPLKGQELAYHLAEFGQRVRFPLLIAATCGMVAGFALLNQGLFESFGSHWYKVGDDNGSPGLCQISSRSGLIHAAQHRRCSQSRPIRPSSCTSTYVRQAAWPASTLLTAFKAFFTLVLVQQIFASLRRAELLTGNHRRFLNPHEPIHERAQFCSAAIR